MMGTNRPAGPVLSIVTPVLDAAHFLPRAIESVRRAHKLGCSIELILADGGSTDGSLEIARSAATGPDSGWIRLIEGPDSGQADAINTGFAVAEGRYLCWLNADDRYRPAGLVEVVEALARSRADVVVGRCVFVDRSGRVVFRPEPPNPVTPASLLKLLSGWYAGRSLVQPEVFVSRRVFDEVGGLDVSLHYTMDHEFWLRLALAGHRFESVEILVAEQLVHPGQKTADNAVVVAEQLGYCKRYVHEYGCDLGTDLAAVEHELGVLERKHAIAGRILAGLGSAATVCSPNADVSADDEILWRLSRSAGRIGSLACVGLGDDERQRVLHRLRPAHPPIVSPVVPRVASAFDAVVWRPRGGQSPWGELCEVLRPGGHGALLGVPDSERMTEAVRRAEKYVRDRITFDSPTILPGRGDLMVLEVLRNLNTTESSFDGTETLEILHSVGFGGLKDHPVLGLFADAFARPESGLWRSVLVRRPGVSGRRSFRL